MKLLKPQSLKSALPMVYGFIVLVLAAVVAQDASAACGQLEVSKGDVQVESGQTKQTAAAPVGAKICSGDTVISGKDSRAKIKMEDGNELNISPDSKIVLENYQFNPAENKKKVLLNVLQGKVRAATKQENMYNDKSHDGADNSFQVKTKSAVAGVRGTDFLTGFDPKSNKSEIVTFRGKVEFGQPGANGQILNPVQVSAGQKTESLPGQPPSAPKSVPPRELQQMNTETKAETAAGGSNSSGNGNAKNGGGTKDSGGSKDSGNANGTASNGGGGGNGNGNSANGNSSGGTANGNSSSGAGSGNATGSAGSGTAGSGTASSGSGTGGVGSAPGGGAGPGGAMGATGSSDSSGSQSGSSSGSAAAGNSPGGGPGSGDAGRAPASTSMTAGAGPSAIGGGGSMIDSQTLVGNPSGPTLVSQTPTGPTTYTPPTTPVTYVPPVIPVCVTCQVPAKAKVNVTITVPGH